MARFGFWCTWFTLALFLKAPLYWSMVNAPWGLIARHQFTIENHFAAFGFLAGITAAMAAVLTGKFWRSTHG